MQAEEISKTSDFKDDKNFLSQVDDLTMNCLHFPIPIILSLIDKRVDSTGLAFFYFST